MKKAYIILLLIACWLPASTVYPYSLFSGAGLGEPVDMYGARARGMGGIFIFNPLTDLTYECSALFESIDDHGRTDNLDFTLPHFRFFLPLPKLTAIDIELNQILNLNFDLEDRWREFEDDSVQRRVKGRGSASMGRVGICKTIAPLSIEGGGFMLFGSSTEEWVIDFGGMADAHDTVGLKLSGAGAMGLLGLELSRFHLSIAYFSGAGLSPKTRLPQRFRASLFFSPLDYVRVAGGITRWQWEEPFNPMGRISAGGEIDIRSLVFRAGLYTGDWYYEIPGCGAIQETVGSAGVGISLKSLCRIDLSFEYGKRWNSLLDERIGRVSVTLQGRETL